MGISAQPDAPRRPFGAPLPPRGHLGGAKAAARGRLGGTWGAPRGSLGAPEGRRAGHLCPTVFIIDYGQPKHKYVQQATPARHGPFENILLDKLIEYIKFLKLNWKKIMLWNSICNELILGYVMLIFGDVMLIL